MAFHKVRPGEAANLRAEVYDPEFSIRIGYRTGDIPDDPRQMLVFVGKKKDTLFEFAVVLSETRDEDAAGYTFTFTGPLDEVRQGFQENENILSEFGNADVFVAYVREGAEMMFTSEGGLSRGSRYICLLT